MAAAAAHPGIRIETVQRTETATMADALGSHTDEDLALLAQGGAMEAFELLVARYEKRIFGFVRQRIGSWGDAEDVTQQAFVKAYRKLDRYNPRYRFATWIFTIARRLTIDHYRRQRPPLALEDVDQVDARDPSRILAGKEEVMRVWKTAREVLSDRQFSVMWLRYNEGLDNKEIANIVGCPSTYTKVLLHRARHRLAQELEREASVDAAATLRREQELGAAMSMATPGGER